ncbi:MAG TPA: hypothetical protein VN713_08255 [Sphingomicrobium sp.]|nr:hypothetical protein [Sphingomicrobium sp.]
MQKTDTPGYWWWAAVGAIALAGLALRFVAAHGGLWTDEAWSVIYAAQARDAAGVFLRINHDNNHHLMSLWLQAIGPAASPLLARAPSILTGALSIVAAAVLAGRRSAAAGIVAALLFAVAPMFVDFGSEARGYAMMLLAALLTLLLVGDAVDGRPMYGARWWLAAFALFGMLSHMTMAAPVGLAALWFYLERRATAGPGKALPDTLRLIGPAIAVTAAVVVFVFTAGALSPTGFRLGGYEPFALPHYTAALDDLALWSAGLSSPWPWLVPFAAGATALIIAFRRPQWLGSRARLYGLLIIAVPLAAGLVRSGNTEFARYYLTSAVGLLLLISDWIARGLEGRPAVRSAAVFLMITLVGVGLYRDLVLIGIDRGRPARPVADMAALEPSGARVAFAEPRLKGVVAVAAERSGYRARFAGGCTPAEFLLASQSRWKPTPATVHRCGVEMDAIDSSISIPLTGDSWVLYRARRLQSIGAADSGPAPGAEESRLSGRAGVAQG